MAIRPPKFEPNLPLPPGDKRYVTRPGAGKALAELLLAGLGPIGVYGPAGSGKSTELARCVADIGKKGMAVHVVLDAQEDVRAMGPERATLWVAAQAARKWMDLGNTVSAPARRALAEAGVWHETVAGPALGGGPMAVAKAVLHELRGEVPHHRLVLLVDGLERSGEDAAVLVKALLRVAEGCAMALVLPLSLAIGPAAHDVLGGVGRMVAIPAVPVPTPDSYNVSGTDEGVAFLNQIAVARHSGVTSLPSGLLDEACEKSGGLPRMFLQALSDAWRYAAAERRTLPAAEDFESAWVDQTKALRRLLVAGDKSILIDQEGESGEEIDLPTRLRLLSHGLLIEYLDGGDPIVFPHPLLADVLDA
jgi:hypothetical protein